MINKLVEDLYFIRELVSKGLFEESYKNSLTFIEQLSEIKDKNINYYILLSNIAGNLVDIGQMQPNIKASEIGCDIMEANKDNFISIIGECAFYYNYGNAKSNLISTPSPFDNTFHTIEELVIVKNHLWRAFKNSGNENKEHQLEISVNLANTLKQQFRLSEALRYYDISNQSGCDIPQAWVNRSTALKYLNIVSSTYSIKLLQEIKSGYLKAAKSALIPPQWEDSYIQRAKETEIKIIDSQINEEVIESEDNDEKLTQEEFRALSTYRQFCIKNHFTLSEHGLYCPCIASADDNLAISNTSVFGNFVVPMEMVLNRLKSEFSLARHLYYEYLHPVDNEQLKNETGFLELFNDEVLGIDIEKLRTAFRLCFGILDKIAVATCELYDLYPLNKGKKDKRVYFQNFWRLDHGNRRMQFEKIKSLGLLALYSIATDLNEGKDGELSFYTSWRNDLEHKFVVIHTSDKPQDLYNSYNLIEDIIFINEADFKRHFEQLIQITRSAIFSFVFMVRHEGMKQKNGNKNNIIYEIHSKIF